MYLMNTFILDYCIPNINELLLMTIETNSLLDIMGEKKLFVYYPSV